MDLSTAQQLIHLNRQFYQSLALPFSATRQRIQPGVRTILGRIPNDARILDLGCGNGELWRTLDERGFHGEYIGLDFSAELLQLAEEKRSTASTARFYQADLTAPGWESVLPAVTARSFDWILAFAVFHHIPGELLRRQALETTAALLDPQGRFVHSEWQFLNSDRLRARLQPWEAAGLSREQVDAGDYLLDWRSGGIGLRYAHHFSEEELHELATSTGFQVIETYYSDGEGGRLGLYQVWQRAGQGA